MRIGPALWRRLRRADRWLVWAFAAWAIALFAVCTRVALRPDVHTVYPIYLCAADRWLAGEDLYALTPQQDFFRYLPPVAVFLVPLHLLPADPGGVLWRCFGTGVFLGGFVWWLRTTAVQCLTQRQLAVSLLLLLPLVVGNLGNGQANLLLAGLLLAGTAAVADRRWTLAAFLLAGACLIKPYAAAVVLLIALIHPRQLAGRLALTMTAGLALPFAFQSTGYVLEQYAGWWRHQLDNDRSMMDLRSCYRDLQLLFRVWIVPLPSAAYTFVEILAAGGMAGLILGGKHRGWPRERLLVMALALGCCWMTALGPATESATYVLLAPSVVAMWISGMGIERIMSAKEVRIPRLPISKGYLSSPEGAAEISPERQPWVLSSHDKEPQRGDRSVALSGLYLSGPDAQGFRPGLISTALSGLIRLNTYARGGPRMLSLCYLLFLSVVLAGLFPDDWKVQALGPQPLAALLFLGVVVCAAVGDVRRRRLT